MFNLGFFGSHNSAIAISYRNKVLEVVELERWLSVKNAAFYLYYKVHNPIQILKEIRNYFELKYGVVQYDVVACNSVLNGAERIFPAKNYKNILHHEAHAYSGLYQSPYHEALIISFDGGSDEGFFNIYIGNKSTGLQKIYSGERDYAVPYMIPAHFIADIKQEPLHWGNLVYSGKIMGLAGYGTPVDTYTDRLTNLYNINHNGDINDTYASFVKLFPELNVHDRLVGDEAKNFAASNQYVFEKLFFEEVTPIIQKYSHLPIVIVGGCGLNILNNTKLKLLSKNVFVPPNPNDCGIALGLVASIIKPLSPIDATYIGSPVWDSLELSKILYERKGTDLDISALATYITDGKIVGIVKDRAEHGPRALGNRSIICNPAIVGMKDTLNAKVKGREYYRPFAPVVRLEDVNKYFEWDSESRWMSFCPKVRTEYKEKLAAITHVDGTARVQTVTREQNSFLYDLLSEMDKKSGIGIILNTSFNIAGKPILNTYKEAVWMLDNKDLDALVLENYFIEKEI